MSCILYAQGFVHASFEGMKSTDSALRLLRQFRSVLQRDSLRADLDAMYSVTPLLMSGTARVKTLQCILHLVKSFPKASQPHTSVGTTILVHLLHEV